SYTGQYLASVLGLGSRTQSPGSKKVQSPKSKVRNQKTPAPNGNAIAVVGAKEHNLQNLSVEIPRDEMVVVTGLSGSGKSTLVFDIVYAEGQRRYIDSLSAYSRQFIKVMARPNVDLLTGIPPTVAIEQRMSRGGRNSTVATITEISHYLRLLYAKAGVQHCVNCAQPLSVQSRSQILDRLRGDFRGQEVSFLAPVVRGRKGFHKDTLEGARKLGFKEALIDGRMTPLSSGMSLARYKEHDIEVVVGSASVNGAAQKIEPLLQTALRVGNGAVHLKGEKEERTYSEKLFCVSCGLGYELLDPRLFSFNSRQGACPECSGLGARWEFDPALVVPDKSKTLNDGALFPLTRSEFHREHTKLLRDLKKQGVPLERPFGELSSEQQRLVFVGDGKAVRGAFTILNDAITGSEGEEAALYPSQFLTEVPCPACTGTRLNPRARAVKVCHHAIWEVMAMSAGDCLRHMTTLPLSQREALIGAPILKEIVPRLSFLNEVGLSYLTL